MALYSSYLYRKGTIFYARLRLPQRLTGWLLQTELRWSLRTSSPQSARRRLPVAVAIAQEFFAVAHVIVSTAHDPLTEDERITIKAELEKLKVIALSKFKSTLSRGPGGIIDAQQVVAAERPLVSAFAQAIAADDFDRHEVVVSAQELLSVINRLGFDFSGNNPNFNYLAKEYCASMVLQHRTKRVLLHQALNKDLEELNPPEAMPVSDHPAPTSIPPVPPADHAPTSTRFTPISQVVSEYLQDLRGRNIREGTVLEYQGVLTKLSDFLNDRPIESLRKTDLMAFREMLRNYPARPTAAQRKLGLKALLELDIPQKLGESTIGKHLDRVSQLLDWAERSDYAVKASIGKGLQPRSNRKESEERDRYTAEDLNVLFSTPEFQGKKAFHRTPYYWVPLISLYQGMRIDEICQLRLCDIALDAESGIHSIRCSREDPDMKLKTNSAVRSIPLHSKLVKLGLLDYVEMLRSKGHRMLFPTLTRHPKNGYSHAVSKWFSDYKKDLGFGPKKVFHSFRHTVSDHFKQTLQTPAVADAIMGHAPQGSEGPRRYGKDYWLAVMQPVIESLSFEVPAKPFNEVKFVDAEKAALRSPKVAEQLRQQRQQARQKASAAVDESEDSQ